MWIKINERDYQTAAGSTLGQVQQAVKPETDVFIVNGYPAGPDTLLQENDRVILIRRGETPSEEELDALLSARHTPGVHDKVKDACVGIAGVGGLGSAIAIALARLGIGRLIIADFDTVEPSNLNRQQYFLDQIGLPKVYALRDSLARINPHVQVTACHLRLKAENISEIFASANLLVEAFDRADQKVMLIEEFAGSFPQKPIVAGSGMAGYGPANAITTERCGRQLFICGDGETPAGPGVGLMSPRVGVAAHHQANAVLRLLLELDPLHDSSQEL